MLASRVVDDCDRRRMVNAPFAFQATARRLDTGKFERERVHAQRNRRNLFGTERVLTAQLHAAVDHRMAFHSAGIGLMSAACRLSRRSRRPITPACGGPANGCNALSAMVTASWREPPQAGVIGRRERLDSLHAALIS